MPDLNQLVHLLDDQMLNMREGTYLPSFMPGDHKKNMSLG